MKRSYLIKRYREIVMIQGYAGRLWDEVQAPNFLGTLRARFAVVWAMITRIPLPHGWFPEGAALPSAAAMTVLPLVGGLFGLLAALPAFLLALFVPPLPAAWIASALYTVAGWSLHLDGWADLWDGVGSGKRGEAMRAVMKDSRTGAFGVAGIVLALSLRASLLSAIDVDSWLPACVVAGGVGRFASAAAACIGDYPWEAGMGRSFVGDFDAYHLFCAFVASCFLFPFAPADWAIGILLAAFSGIALSIWANRNLGGVNGDVLGAAAVLGEILVLIACAS